MAAAMAAEAAAGQVQEGQDQVFLWSLCLSFCHSISHHLLPALHCLQVVVNFRHITELENHGVNRSDLTKLMEAGFCTVESITHATLRKLTDIKGISEQKAQKIKETAYKLVPMGFLTVKKKKKQALSTLPGCFVLTHL